MVVSLLGPDFVPQEASRADTAVASILFGFFLGFGFLTAWEAAKQTRRIYKRYGWRKLNTPYVWVVWLEIFACLSYSIINWLFEYGIIPPGYVGHGRLRYSRQRPNANIDVQHCLLLLHW